MGMLEKNDKEEKMFFVFGVIVCPLLIAGSIYAVKHFSNNNTIYDFAKIPRETMAISTAIVTPKKSNLIKLHPNKF